MGILRLHRRFHGLYHSRTRSSLLLSNYIYSRVLSSSRRIYSEDSVLPVIIGAGPVGLVLSIILSRLGVKCAVLEKNKAFSRHPQAHFINNRSMEIFRKIDGMDDEILRNQPPVDLWRKFVYCTSLTGPVLGSVDHMQPQGTVDFESVPKEIIHSHD